MGNRDRSGRLNQRKEQDRIGPEFCVKSIGSLDPVRRVHLKDVQHD
ncbi:MAG: hypothetical protein AB1558_04445 [Thermodesulfobacteriota bacterium]